MTYQSASAADLTCQSARAVLAFALVLLLLAIAACSEEQKTDEVEPYPPPNPLFYELANADGEVEGWLLGTIHALPEGVSWRTAQIDRVVEEADFLAVEVASLGKGDTVRQAFLELSQSPGLRPIEDRVAPDLRPDLDAMVARLNTSRAILRSSEDWAAAIMLAQVDAPGDPQYGVDRALIAQFSDREVIGFETARTQLGIFDQLAPQDQRELLEGTVEDWAASKANPERLLRAWLSGDEKTLEAATIEGIMADPELRDALLVQRNSSWMAQLAPKLNEMPRPLIAVGAAHLVGPDGLVTMLKAQGYTVRRLPAL
ncbi:hypothetical protein EH31_01600 [Erythrobacter longus]|uniref:Polysaccharide biosynthesis protein GumN n=1 Tax=Erythrobacter longus TaxID=1044 RepID=A0A074MD34_ERYLO|nr:TraB/GumN family protein [Erythrobacter longus]KEO91384.1 hypothetical protein EH31_01600 [Erythrobacter longus]